MHNWEQIAHLIEVNYGGLVDWKEKCFYCPECGEPVYEADWDDIDFMYGRDLLICPICESVID